MYKKLIEDIQVNIPVVYVKEVQESYGKISKDLASYGNATIVPLDHGFSADGYDDLIGKEITIYFMMAFKGNNVAGWPYVIYEGRTKLKGFKVEFAYAEGINVPEVSLTANLMATLRGLVSCIRSTKAFKYKGNRSMATCNNCVNALRIPYDTDDTVLGVSAIRSKSVSEQSDRPGACDVACLAHFRMVDEIPLERIAKDRTMIMQQAGWVKSEGRRETAEYCEYFAPRFINNNLVTHSVGGKFTGTLKSFNLFGGGFLLTSGRDNKTYWNYRGKYATGEELKVLCKIYKVKPVKA